MKTDTKNVLLILAVCFLAALGLGLTGWFESASAPIVAGTVWGLTAVTLLACWSIPVLKHWVRATQIRYLIAMHLIRFVGVYFLVLCRAGKLSCRFAEPAGVGDIAVAIGAVGLLIWHHRSVGSSAWIKAVAVWNVFGLADIVFVVINALRIGLNDWPAMAPLRTLPLMLLPTFLVPLIIASHILIFVRLRSN